MQNALLGIQAGALADHDARDDLGLNSRSSQEFPTAGWSNARRHVSEDRYPRFGEAAGLFVADFCPVLNVHPMAVLAGAAHGRSSMTKVYTPVQSPLTPVIRDKTA
ncbi:hypothetical protein D3C81_1111280 [compost metagenome]